MGGGGKAQRVERKFSRRLCLGAYKAQPAERYGYVEDRVGKDGAQVNKRTVRWSNLRLSWVGSK